MGFGFWIGFQNCLFLDYLSAGNRLLELTWVIRSMNHEEKNGGVKAYWRSSTLVSSFRTKKSPSNQNLPYIMLKARFPFLYESTSLDTKTLKIASNRNFESCLSIRCLAPKHILRFFPFLSRVLRLPLATLLIIVSSSSTLLWAIEVKKRFSNGLLFPRNLDLLTPGGPIFVPLVCSFRRQDNLLAWRVVCEPKGAEISHLIWGGIQPLWANL